MYAYRAMKMGEEKIWTWQMPNGKLFKVVTNPEKGTIRVYDPAGELVLLDDTLSRAAVSFVEKNFLEVVTTIVKREETRTDPTEEISMYIR